MGTDSSWNIHKRAAIYRHIVTDSIIINCIFLIGRRHGIIVHTVNMNSLFSGCDGLEIFEGTILDRNIIQTFNGEIMTLLQILHGHIGKGNIFSVHKTKGL